MLTSDTYELKVNGIYVQRQRGVVKHAGSSSMVKSQRPGLLPTSVGVQEERDFFAPMGRLAHVLAHSRVHGVISGNSFLGSEGQIEQNEGTSVWSHQLRQTDSQNSLRMPRIASVASTSP